MFTTRAALTKSSLRSITTTNTTTNFSRAFSQSSPAMTIKTYFDCQWTGPEYKTDASGKIISKDDSVARK